MSAMSTATATAPPPLANVVQLPLQGGGLPDLIESECHDCGHVIFDETSRVFCENCIALDDLALARSQTRTSA